MSTSRSNINIKALGIHWRDGRLLASEVYDSHGHVSGVRPLGGTVEFGECSATAVKREFLEELGIEIAVLSGPAIIENIYAFEGENGHEIIFVFEIDFVSDDYRHHETMTFNESDGTSGIARWYDLNELDRPGFPRLYPTGLKAILTR